MPTELQQVFEIKLTRAEAWAILGATPEEDREEPLNWVQQRIAQMLFESTHQTRKKNHATTN